jgi:hypothetical protein
MIAIETKIATCSAKEEYSKETIFQDTTYVFDEYINKYNAN